jgi:pantetheine-phosphate adenylyltransferase
MPRIALFAGSFDPMTNGHLDVVRSSVSMVDRLVLAVGIHPGKVPLFAAEERIAMLEEVCAPVARAAGCEIAFLTFADLVITAAQRAGATILIRGVRDGTDFDYEMQMAGMNAVMAPEVQTIFLPASPAQVAARLKQKFAK